VQADFVDFDTFIGEVAAPKGAEKKDKRTLGITLDMSLPMTTPVGSYVLVYITPTLGLCGISNVFPVSSTGI
jgi:hypothetical protein